MHSPVIKAVILAAGSGERFAGDDPKQFVKLAGHPVLLHTLKPFQYSSEIAEIIIVTLEPYVNKIWDITRSHQLSKVKKVVIGGKTRQESSRIGIDCCGENTDYVLIHDGVRPFITVEIIKRVVDAVKIHQAVDTVISTTDTIVEVDSNNFIREIPNRSFLRRGQTPQAFAYDTIKEAHILAEANGIKNSTDDCALVLKTGKKVFTVEGQKQNIKITYPIDLHVADKLFQLRQFKTTSFDESQIRDKLCGKVFLIVGGTSGIGQCVSDILSKFKGIRVFPLGRKSHPPIDVTDFKSIQEAVNYILRTAGQLDYLINCAGVLTKGDVTFTTLEEWDNVFDTNLKGSFLLTKAVLPYFIERRSGYITYVGSSSYTRGRGGYAAYSSSKAALVNFCQALAEEVYDYNIRVNVVSPGRVATPLRYRNFGKEDPKTLLSPEYVAEKILMSLLVDTTGSVFEINGNEKYW